MGGLLSEYVDEARSLGSQILDALIEGNRQREKASKDKPPARALSKLDVVAEAQLRTVPFIAEKLVPLSRSQVGIYTKINHWAAQLEAEGVVKLYYGNDASNAAILDVAAKNQFAFSNPNELVIPPGMEIFVFCEKAGVITLSVTSYQLGL